MKRIVLAYSGGLDTSVAIPWLAERYGAEIVAVTMDLGQGKELDDVRERALAIGAVRAHVLDLREEFARDYILPALQAGAIYEGRYPLATALGRPLISKHLVEVARLEGAEAIAHGCTGKGNDQVRMDVSARALEPGIQVIAPARVWGLSRPEEIEYARERGIPVPATVASPYSTDANLWGRSIECGVLEDPWQEPPEEIYALTKPPQEAPDRPAYVEVEFERGVPVKINGVAMGLVELIQSLETIAGGHGVGRIDMVENRFVGLKSRGVYETPGGTVLHYAHRAVESITMDRDVMHERDRLSPRFAELIYNGFWFSPEMAFVRAAIEASQQNVTGEARVKLFKGAVRVTGRRSPVSLYSEALSSFEDAGPEDTYDQADATGFIRLQGLRLSRRDRA
jgi:argininosuccinate synthase